MLGPLIAAGANIIGGLLGNKSSEKNAEQNIALQKEFAKSGIQWKVADAKKAGVHPLYALGAQTHSFAPVSVGDSLGPAIGAAGQDISRAIDSTSSTSTRVAAFNERMQALQLHRGELENILLASQIARLNQVQSRPPMPVGDAYLVEGQGNASMPGWTQFTPPADSGQQGTAAYSQIPGIMIEKQLLQHAPGWASGQQYEDAYGEGGPMSWLYGVARQTRDLIYNSPAERFIQYRWPGEYMH